MVRFMPHALAGSTNAERLALHVQRMPSGCLEWTRGRFPKGYGALVDLDTGKVRGAHVMAWEQVHGPVPKGLCVCHHCDNPPCCDPEHLFLGTKGDNARDMVAKGRKHIVPAEQHVRGSKHPQAKLSEEQVAEIRQRLENNKHGLQSQLAREYGVSLSTIHLIKKGHNWAHMAGGPRLR